MKKAGNARRRLLAYRHFVYIHAMQTARLILRKFLYFKKTGNARRRLLAYRHFAYIQAIQTARSVYAIAIA
jgi:hypothetical protein